MQRPPKPAVYDGAEQCALDTAISRPIKKSAANSHSLLNSLPFLFDKTPIAGNPAFTEQGKMSNKHKNKGRHMDHTTTPVTSPTTSEHSAEEAVQATQESLDQVRDILFGNQMRDQDRRFVTIEEKIAADFAAFREETRQNLGQLETFIKNELATLGSYLATEARQRQEATGTLRNELTTAAQALEKQLGEINTQHTTAEADVRRQLLEQSATARNELKTTQAELTTFVEKLTADLRNAKTDRTALAGLFTEMAARLQ
jgi:hypothetical protein